MLRLKRISSIRRNNDTIIQTLPDSVIRKWSTPRVYDEYTFIDNTSINKYHSIYLFNSVDGKGLELGTPSHFINNWITSPIKMFSGRDFVDMVKLKHSLLYTHYRCKRMFPSLNTNCLRRGCNYKYDCLNHIMQTCRFNYNNIIHRHNYVNALLITILNKYTFTTILEPHVRTQFGLRKPDLLAYRNYIVYIIDTQISTDTIDTNTNYRHKTDYYNKPEILSYAKQLTGAKQAKLSASCWNWRVIPSSLTYKDLYSLGLRKHDIS